jgi:hypothetical protein
VYVAVWAVGAVAAETGGGALEVVVVDVAW